MGSAKKIKNHDVNSKTRTARANEIKLKSFSELLNSQGEVIQSNCMFLFLLILFLFIIIIDLFNFYLGR